MTRKVHLRANWANQVSEVIKFKTSIFTSSGGKEQRSAERLTPRREVRFTALLNGTARQLIQTLLETKGVAPIQIADPIRLSTVVPEIVPIGATVFTVEKRPAWLVGGVTAALVTEHSTAFVDVLNVSGNLITLVDPLVRPIPAGAAVRLAMGGSLKSKATFSAVTDSVASLPVTIEQEVGAAMPLLGPDDLPTFEDRPVLTVAPNWQRGASVSIESQIERIDFDRGVYRDYLKHDILSRITQFDYTGRGTEDLGALLTLFNACRGRHGDFWCPSWLADMTPTEGIEIGDTQINVDGRHIADFYNTSKMHKAIAIRLSDGQWLFRRVTGITVNGADPGEYSDDFSDDFTTGSSIIEVDEPFETDAELPEDFSTLRFITPLNVNAFRLEILGVYWLHLCRFATDEMTVNWITDDVGQATAQIMALEYNPVETLTP